MSDVFTKSKRSEVMSRIRSRGNKATELALAGFFRRHKITGWRRQRELRMKNAECRIFKVRPDFVFPGRKLAIFVDGCFWHGCPRHGTRPKGNAVFWRKKITGNRFRDRLVVRTLRKSGWRVLRIWEHELARRREAHLNRRIGKQLKS
jgi:DNA mismatch endonuclease (patch repair protein)